MASELIDRKLYNGKYHLIHNPVAKGSSPRYKLMAPDGKIAAKPKGVTTILGAVLAKDFVSWALDMMAAALQEKLPIITQEDIEHAKLASTRKRDSGANTGSEAHALVENFLKHGIVACEDASQEAKNAFQAFLTWFQKVKPDVLNVEEVIYSEQFEYGGTYDCMLKIDGKVALCDYKTTNSSRKAPNGVYAEYFIQLGAYAAAHEEQRLYEEANGGTKLLPIEELTVISCQKNGKLNVVCASDIGLSVDDCMGMWKRVINLFSFLKFATTQLGGK